MEKDIATHKLNYRFAGTETIVSKPVSTPVLVEQTRLLHAVIPALFLFLIRLPYLYLGSCFFCSPEYYLPETPSCHGAIRVSTYS